MSGRGPGLTSPARVDPVVAVREVTSGEPLPFLGELRPGAVEAGMSRAMPRYLGGAQGVLAFVAEVGRDARRPVALVWCVCGRGTRTVTVRFARMPGVDDSVMSLLFTHLRQAASTRGARWLRWRLAKNDLPLLESIRRIVGVPVLHREGPHVVAEVAVSEAWRSR